MTQPKAYSYIRFSTPEQAKGHSLKRQLEASENYAKKHGLVLDEGLRFIDMGVPAFRGIHRTKGALGQFLNLVEKGEVAKGSLLIVENLDRLSREQVLDALGQFNSIIKAGIKVITLQDGMEYSEESINANFGQLLMSIVFMSRAYEESLTKSKRGLSSWENKRAKATTNDKQKLTGRCPAWLTLKPKLKKDEKRANVPSTFKLLDDRVSVIKQIFEMKLAGRGSDGIAKRLNELKGIWKPENPKRGSYGWRKSYINKILRNSEVIGIFQPFKKIKDDKGKYVRKPEGDPIHNYFPPAIDEDLFYAVQNQIRQNRELNGNAGGPTGKCKNLFVHVVKCGLCKNPMHFFDKGKPPKGGQYLQCDQSARKLGCVARPIRYDEFEKLFFDNFEELNISELLPDKDEIQIHLDDLNRKITSNSQRIINLEDQRINLLASIRITKDDRNRKLLDRELSKTFDKKEKLQVENQRYEIAKNDLERQRLNLQADIDMTKEIHAILQSEKDGQRQINIRRQLRTEIKKLLEQIEIYPLMEEYTPMEEIEPGVIQWMNSKDMDKVRIRFKGVKKMRLLYLRGMSEITNRL